MELQAFLQIFRTYGKFFWGTIALGTFLGFLWAVMQPVSYSATLTLNIARSGNATAPDEYNDFYRLQADERFADTVVRWLGAPRVAANVFARVDEDAGAYTTKSLRHYFDAKRLSSHVIDVTYSAVTLARAQYYADALIAELNAQSRYLNAGTQRDWFVVVGEEPIVRDGRTDTWKAMAVGAFLATVVALWGTVFCVYRKPQDAT